MLVIPSGIQPNFTHQTASNTALLMVVITSSANGCQQLIPPEKIPPMFEETIDMKVHALFCCTEWKKNKEAVGLQRLKLKENFHVP
jgi:hypothetical protein